MNTMLIIEVKNQIKKIERAANSHIIDRRKVIIVIEEAHATDEDILGYIKNEASRMDFRALVIISQSTFYEPLPGYSHVFFNRSINEKTTQLP